MNRDGMTNPSMERHDLRMTLLSACAWRLIAELARRHSTSHVLHVVQFHPGLSVRGCIGISIEAGDQERETFVHQGRFVTLNLGGPEPGTVEGIDFVAGLLGKDPAATVDRVGSLLGLRFAGQLPESTSQAVACRVIAEALARCIFDRMSYRTTSAWSDYSDGVMLGAWAQRFDALGSKGFGEVAKRVSAGDVRASDQRRLSRLVAVHRCDDADNVMLGDDQDALLVDLHSSEAIVTRDGRSVLKANLLALYVASGRQLDPVMAHLDHVFR